MEIQNIVTDRFGSWNGLDIQMLEGDVPVDLTGTTIKMSIKNDACEEDSIVDYAIGSGITLVDAANGRFIVDEKKFSFKAGKYKYDILVVLSSGLSLYIVGGTLTVNATVTRP